MFYSKEKGKYALLYDGTIVKIKMWSEPYDDYGETLQDIYFNYSFLDRLKFGKKSAFAFHKDYIAFSNNKRELRKIRKTI